ncbi:hypothetical protein EJ04DRAFT_523565 [Polyplosphaeria fusca]|uniref:Uncharacterized protein n=1 Tax=Polyplosphaeria fusca TaxID=682080 RepID=A0A9P4QVQ9_9PLEO|nr:hypothetical protein EJ04DRAFT_523565 [Polyplosphaeria fusca]
MRSIALSALCGLAAAAPRPQGFNIAAVDNLVTPSVLGPDVAAVTPNPVTYNPEQAANSAAAAISTAPAEASKRSLQGREACSPQPDGEGDVPGDGSVEAYLDSNSAFAQAANAAGTPSGYVQTFKNLQASVQEIGYLTYKVLQSAEYDVNNCAAFCDGVKFCLGFNIYFERDPSLEPASSCPNPAPMTNIKCSLYGYPVYSESATNTGQWRDQFHVVIAGSNGYSKLNPLPSPSPYTNFTGPSPLLPGAINAPTDTVPATYLGMKLYNDGPYDPSQCAAACQAQTAYDRETAGSDGTYDACNFFNSYILTKNNVPQGTYCSFYTRSWSEEYAVNTGYYYGGDVFAVVGSFTYGLTVVDGGHV